MAETLAECDVRNVMLDNCQRELAEAKEKERCIEHEKIQLKQRLDIQAEQNQQLKELVQRLEVSTDALCSELKQLRAQFAPLAQSVDDTAHLRAVSEDIRAKLVSLRDQPAGEPAEQGHAAQLATAHDERQQLEHELDRLRHRAAELSAALDDQKRLGAAERDRWNDELRSLRAAVERQSDILAGNVQSSPAGGPRGASSTVRQNADTQAEDAVLDSVLEQFEMLQKNKVRKMAGSSG